MEARHPDASGTEGVLFGVLTKIKNSFYGYIAKI
jgi:hypothetical protein